MAQWTYSNFTGDVGVLINDGNTVVAGTSDGEIARIYQGSEKWNVQLDTRGISDMWYDGGNIYTVDGGTTRHIDRLDGSVSGSYRNVLGEAGVWGVNPGDVAVAAGNSFSIQDLNSGFIVSEYDTETIDYTDVEGDDTVPEYYVTTGTGYVYVFDKFAGKQSEHLVDSQGLFKIIRYGSGYIVASGGSDTVYRLDSSFNELWSYTPSDTLEDVALDSGADEVYVAVGGLGDKIDRVDATNGNFVTDYVSPTAGVSAVTVINGDAVYGAGTDAIKITDSEFTAFATASQVSALASMLTPTLTPRVTINATQTTVSTLMAGDTKVSPVATQISVNVTMLSADARNLYEYATASQRNITAVNTEAGTTDRNTEWDVYDSEQTRHVASIVEDTGTVPDWKRGQEFSEVFIFDEDAYNKLKGEYGRYLRDETVTVSTDYRGRPYFTQNPAPNSTQSSYVFRVIPNPTSEMEPFWTVVTNINDSTRVAEGGKALELTMMPLAPTDEYTRSQVTQVFESSL